jgi:uncharacterized membrane protein YgcG
VHRKFAVTQHRIPACIASLRDLPEPDVVIISQATDDHCHRASLCQLPAHGTKTVILAHPAAAKRIRRWRHFHPDKVQALPVYNPRSQQQQQQQQQQHRLRGGVKATSANIRRFALPPPTPTGSPGEVTLALMVERFDLTRLHAAIGITYRPPSAATTSTTTTAAAAAATASEATMPSQAPPPTPPPDPLPTLPVSRRPASASLPPSPSPSPPPPSEPLSVIYSPHGVSPAAIRAYAATHLAAERALPLHLLLHAFDRVQNAWFLGGTVATGVPGGLPVAHALRARFWLSAHDGDTAVGGIGTKTVRVRRYARDEAQQLMRAYYCAAAAAPAASALPLPFLSPLPPPSPSAFASPSPSPSPSSFSSSSSPSSPYTAAAFTPSSSSSSSPPPPPPPRCSPYLSSSLCPATGKNGSGSGGDGSGSSSGGNNSQASVGASPDPRGISVTKLLRLHVGEEIHL